MINPFNTIPENVLIKALNEAIELKIIKVMDILWILSTIEDTSFGKVEVVRQDGKTLEVLEHRRRRQPKFLQPESPFIDFLNKHIEQYINKN